MNLSTQSTSKPHTTILTQRAACIALALILTAAPILSAQTTAPAPLPSQLSAAKTVFIANAFEAQGPSSEAAYDQVYAAVQALNRFTIVSSPQQADIILQFSLTPNGLAEVLHITDPKTNVRLWSVSEGIRVGVRGSTAAKNTQIAINNLANDLQTICTPQPPTAP
jgi:hypothetical protein